MTKNKPIKTWEEFVAASKRLRAKQVFVDSRLEAFQETVRRQYEALREELSPTFCEIDQLADGCQVFLDGQFPLEKNEYTLVQAGYTLGGGYMYCDKYARLGHRMSAGLWE